MFCGQCGHQWDAHTAFCGVCGAPLYRRLPRRSLIAAIVAVAAAVIMQIGMLCPLMTLTLDRPQTITWYDLHTLADGVTSVIGGMPSLTANVWWVKLAVVAVQLGILLTTACGVLTLISRKQRLALVGLLGGLLTAGVSAAVLFAIFDTVSMIKTRVILEAITIHAAPMVILAAAVIGGIACAVLWLDRR